MERLSQATQPLLWLADDDYMGRLLAGGNVPWRDPTALVSLRRRAHALLRPDVVAVDAGAMLHAFGIEPGSVAPAELDDALSDATITGNLEAILHGLRGSLPGVLALVIPGPRTWSAGVAGDPIDALDQAAFALSAFLRVYSAVGVDTLLLDEHGRAPPDEGAAEWFRPIINVGHHLSWDVGIRSAAIAPVALGVDFCIAPAAATGVEIPDSFWTAATTPVAPIGGRFRYGRIPPEASPEQVLERRAALATP